jgi:hypothetical protein
VRNIRQVVHPSHSEISVLNFPCKHSAKDQLPATRMGTPLRLVKVGRLIGLSELQHRLSAQIGHYMDGEKVKVYAIDVFAKILFEKATYYQVLPLFERSD